jgi:hypothetical protein
MIASDKTSGLTAERLRTLLHYDPLTGVWTWLVSRGKAKARSVAGCVNSDGYIIIGIDGRIYFAHRLAVLFMTGQWPVSIVDHENLVKSDNRWKNLRPATYQQNNVNVGVRNANALGVKGVCLKPSGKFEASIRINGKLKYLGLHTTATAASATFAKAAKDNWGEFSRTTPVLEIAALNLPPAPPKGPNKNNKLGVKGVYVEGGKYQAQIQVNGKQKYLGTFTTIELASAARVAAANDNRINAARVSCCARSSRARATKAN